MSFFILQVLPYITIPLFTIGVLYRLGRWAGARIVHNITLSHPNFPKTWGEAGVEIGAQAVLFKSLFVLDRALWIGGWPMHIALLNVLGGHFVGFYFLGRQFAYIPGISEHLSEQMSNFLGTSFGIVLFIFLLYLLYRRIAVEPVRRVTVTSDYLHLALLLAIVTVGDIMRLVPDWGIHYEPVKEYFTYLFMLQPVPAGAEILHKPLVAVHVLLVQILMVIFPFSKLMHVFGMFALRYVENRPYQEPEPGIPGVDLSKGVPAKSAAAGEV
ncbi:MAG: respiratory nitrate reductase subunit gamma [Peptococcaceae bacterium]|nr:respiratory nitrate reductase subunit gamma [Peptococcaceae bacterium]